MAYLHTAIARELHHSINPALAEFDRLICGAVKHTVQRSASSCERALFVARARAIVARTLKEGR